MTPSPATAAPDPRARAAAVSHAIAERLADPEGALAQAPGRAPSSLDDGHPAMTLLCAELSHEAPELRRAAHAHLAAGAALLTGGPPQSLFRGGVPALAFAAHAARRTPDDYAGLLARLDTALDRVTRGALEPERARLDAGRAGVGYWRYDLINGITGLTRLLLLRRATHPEASAAALTYLVRLTRPLTRDGAPVPGWWSPDGPGAPGDPHPEYPRGHVNFGLAHGISGPLAVLSAALRDGVSVPGLREAVTALVAELLAHRTEAGGWPAWTALERYGTEPPAPGRTAWCYGTPATAAALHQAGRALGDTGLRILAADALADDLDRPRRVTDHAFCHGHAGLLHLCHTLTEDTPHPRLTDHRDALAARLVAAYDPELPYGFPAVAAAADPDVPYGPRPPAAREGTADPDLPYGARTAPASERPGPPDPVGGGTPAGPGLLSGAAGIALALHAYATDAPPRTSWDAAFLLR
ncbi:MULTISPECIES: lanthionine synthetase C family protein [Streptomyces]|uniref:Lanthionine synthetase C family protein n=1 Tax=Streptomyces ramulosus TaxID=47762 RepID=A0ABW1FKV1_9ACTN